MCLRGIPEANDLVPQALQTSGLEEKPHGNLVAPEQCGDCPDDEEWTVWDGVLQTSEASEQKEEADDGAHEDREDQRLNDQRKASDKADKCCQFDVPSPERSAAEDRISDQCGHEEEPKRNGPTQERVTKSELRGEGAGNYGQYDRGINDDVKDQQSLQVCDQNDCEYRAVDEVENELYRESVVHPQKGIGCCQPQFCQWMP